MTGIRHNGITISVQNWKPWKKLPVLAVEVEGDNSAYKVASFNSEETARWFVEVCEEFFKGLVKGDGDAETRSE